MTTFYTSDHHFYHKNILEFEQRPYETVEEMNIGLIKIWNEQVKKEDTVYHLGDFCFGTLKQWIEIREQLNGKIILIKGNHDKSKIIAKMSDYFEEILEFKRVKIDSKLLFLFHYPIETGLTPNVYSIGGHIHSKPNNFIGQINVGVDSDFVKETVGFGRLIPEDLLLKKCDEEYKKIIEIRNNKNNQSVF